MHDASPSISNGTSRADFVLCLDGGGIRGYSSLLILQRLMEEIVRYENGAPESVKNLDGSLASSSQEARLPCDYFDYIVGTSTGGLAAIMLGRLCMSVDESLEQYRKLGTEIFGQPRLRHIRQFRLPFFWWARSKYNHEKFEQIIQEVVNQRIPRERGDEDYFPWPGLEERSTYKRCKTIVIAVLRDSNGERPWLFRTYNSHLHPNNRRIGPLPHPPYGIERNSGPAYLARISQVARAAAAAPTYFKRALIDGREYIDAGFGWNNPSRLAYNEVYQMQKIESENNPENDRSNGHRNISLLSIGTGKPKTNAPKGSDAAGFRRYIYFANAAAKMATNSENVVEDMTSLAYDRPSLHYERFNVEEGLGKMRLDEWEESKTLALIQKVTEAYLSDNEVTAKLREWAKKLADAKRNRT